MVEGTSFGGFRKPGWVVVTLVALTVSGCFGNPDASRDANGTDSPTMLYWPIDEAAMSKPTHAILDPLESRFQASSDGVSLFAEVYLPDGPGPWPSIIHSTPYKHERKTVYPAFEVAAPTGAISAPADFVERYVPRGYAVVLADVRGFGDSGGCVEVWGKNERQDQYDLVEWAASQPWSNGKVGMVGLSYPGTTPIEAAVMSPPHLVTIVVAAGLTDPYFDWHYGGVPNGESSQSPAEYEAIGAVAPLAPVSDPLDWAQVAAQAGCGTADFIQEAWRQDSVYTDFFAERNFTRLVGNIRASVLYSQGFLDASVKPNQILNFFNEIPTPKKALLGQWIHEFPTRSDYVNLEIAWFDHWLKGAATGVMRGPTVEIVTNVDTWRADVAFPSQTSPLKIWLDASDMSLRWGPTDAAGEASFVADRRPDGQLPGFLQPYSLPRDGLVFRSAPVEQDVYVSGVIEFSFTATLDAENAYLLAELYTVTPERAQRIAFGGLAAALREGFDEYKPVPAGQALDYGMSFMPREFIVQQGEALELRLRTLDIVTTHTTEAMGPTTVTLLTGPGTGSTLAVPSLSGRPDLPLPWIA